jgi:SIR2-like domain
MPPPYGLIWNRLKAGKVVPFLGAGASFVGRPPDAKWDATTPIFLPSGLELAHFLANEAEFPSTDPHDRDDLAKVSSYYADIGGRRTLRERLREVLNHPYQSGSLHEFLAAVPASLVVVVTNYDTLVEQAFRAAGKPYELVVYPTDRKDFANAILWWRHGSTQPVVTAPNELDIDLAKTTVIYKMHGTIFPESDEWDNFVITEEDYVEFLSRMTTSTAIPSLLYPYFRERSFLFLGYSLRDWNLRVVLKNLSKYLPKRTADSDDDEHQLPSWAIQRNPSELEGKLWAKRRVGIFDLTLDEFVTRMREQMGR